MARFVFSLRSRLPLFALVLVAACDPAAPAEGTAPGQHSLTLNGASTLSSPWHESITGRALFAPTNVADGGGTLRRLSVQLQDARTNRFVLFSLDTFDDTLPSPGTYPTTPDERGEAGAFYLSLAETQIDPSYTEFFEAESGTVTITAASASRIEGRFDVSMRTAGFSAPGGNAVHATGTFSATPAR